MFDIELTMNWMSRMPKDVKDRFRGVYEEDVGDGQKTYFVAWTEGYEDYDHVRGGELPVRNFREAVRLLRYELNPVKK